MKYRNADSLLPEALVRELQKYIQGEYLYVPAPSGQRRSWGERSGSRKILKERNEKIRQRFREGFSLEKLSEDFNLSIHAIRKIVYKQ